ncbi:hypothetical protein BH11BAC4_BH11BAC4_15350 [soil metagenome]
MSHTKTIIAGLIVCGTVLFLASCYKDKTVLVDNTEEFTAKVSFVNNLVPIFNQSCNMVGCHSSGGQVPDLTINNAYRSIKEQDLIDVTDPKNSEIMGWLTGTIKPAMPLGGQTNPSNINAIMLAWIKQGAKNN